MQAFGPSEFWLVSLEEGGIVMYLPNPPLKLFSFPVFLCFGRVCIQNQRPKLHFYYIRVRKIQLVNNSVYRFSIWPQTSCTLQLFYKPKLTWRFRTLWQLSFCPSPPRFACLSVCLSVPRRVGVRESVGRALCLSVRMACKYTFRRLAQNLLL